MSIREKSVLVFGGGDLQLSIIEECRKLNLFTVVIDPNPNAEGRKHSDAFEVVEGRDFEGTCSVVEKYSIEALITAATDKPLIIMARVAEKYKLPFFSEETAVISTDKHLMKKVFQENGIPCASGNLINAIGDSHKYPLILKPRDNSGSRGIVFCQTKEEAQKGLEEAFNFSKKETILAEEFIEGMEYSIEALHFNNESHVLQITEKITTPHPYNVELGHIQPPELSVEDKKKISELVADIAKAMKFQNCASHTEVKVNQDGIFVIETSPRLGGDFITSQLVPLSTGINMEKALLQIALGLVPDVSVKKERAAAIFYFDFKKDRVTKNLEPLKNIQTKEGVVDFLLNLKEGMEIPKIKNSLDRYGYIILTADKRNSLLELADKYINEIEVGI